MTCRDTFEPASVPELHHSFWLQLLVDALFLAILIALCSLTYLLVERPMQNVGRRVGRWFDVRFGPDRYPESRRPHWPSAATRPTSASAMACWCVSYRMLVS
jgi:peptidoglycan/LPS O-acetylase OafA/YrhL